MEITVNKRDIKILLKEHLPNDVNIDDVSFDDGKVSSDKIDEVITDIVDESTEDTEVDASWCADVSGISNVLVKALNDQNAKSMIPEDPDTLCKESITELLNNMTSDEKDIFIAYISAPDFQEFAMLWQSLQNTIHTKL